MPEMNDLFELEISVDSSISDPVEISDLGVLPVEGLTISGMNFNDFDLDGMMDPGESGVQVWTVWLMGDGYELFSTITDEDGLYEFGDLEPGDYTISLDLLVFDQHNGPGCGLGEAPFRRRMWCNFLMQGRQDVVERSPKNYECQEMHRPF